MTPMLSSLPPALTAFLLAVLATVTFLRGRQQPANYCFALLCLLGCFLNLDILIQLNAPSADTALRFTRRFYLLHPFSGTAFHSFLSCLSGNQGAQLASHSGLWHCRGGGRLLPGQAGHCRCESIFLWICRPGRTHLQPHGCRRSFCHCIQSDYFVQGHPKRKNAVSIKTNSNIFLPVFCLSVC